MDENHHERESAEGTENAKPRMGAAPEQEEQSEPVQGHYTYPGHTTGQTKMIRWPSAKDWFDFLLVLFTGILALTAYFQWTAISETLVETRNLVVAAKVQADAAKIQADAARLQADAARAANEITMSGVQQSIEASNIAAKALKATQESNANSREFFRMDQRAWITVAEVTGKWTDAPRLSFEYQNTGHSPAVSVQVSATATLRQTDGSSDENALALDRRGDETFPLILNRRGGVGILAPAVKQSTTVGFPEKFEPNVMYALGADRTRIYLFVVITYKDIFETDHRTAACYFTKPGERFSQVSFDIWPCVTGNTAN